MVDFGGWANENYRIPGEKLEDVMSEDLGPRRPAE